MLTPYADFVAELREHTPAHRRHSMTGSVLDHLAEQPRGLEEPQWLMLAAVIVAEAGDPWNDDEARGAMVAHARRSTLAHARRARSGRGPTRRRG